ncbi:MAG: hypothetical protein R2685_14140 [Candidatus Nitrosocosmicus sp.]|nr:hypothetical protein [Candidatus Nitrosocosmicus sp.]
MKFVCSLFLISFVFIATGSNIGLSSFGSTSDSNSTNNTSNETVSNLSNQTTDREGKYNNSTSPAILSTDEEKDKGLLIVNVTTINGEIGTNTSSDFIVNIHANNPVPASFNGGPETLVKLSMGMYTVTISSIPNYNSSFSGDCTGGIMNVETKICNIVNTYNNQ